jgi:Papain-like cysteine protease AvrRpt2
LFGSLTERLHPVMRFGQPTGMSCWSAAATSILGNQSVGPGRATLLPSGGLSMTDLPNMETFITGLGWRIVNRQTRPPLASFLPVLQRKPLWVAFQGYNFAHAVVFSGVYSDGASDNSGLVIRIHDPWPPGSHGEIYGSTVRHGTMMVGIGRHRQAAMVAFIAEPN